jgi:hypothetical protein
MGIFFQKNGSQYVTDGHLRLFSRAGMVDCPLDDTLEADGLLKHIFVAVGDLLDLFLKEVLKRGDQIFNIAAAVFDDVNPGGIV